MNKKLMLSLMSIVLIVVGFLVYKELTGIKVASVDTSIQQQKIMNYANPEAVITAEALHALLEDKTQDVVVIGTMNSADQVIPGSFAVWRPDYSGTDLYPYGGMANTKEELEALLSSFGVNTDTTIVTYAANDQHDSARIFWQFKMLGHDDVRLLDGGINVWIGNGFETGEQAKIGDRPQTDYKAPNYNAAAFTANLETVMNAVDNEDFIILDTRAKDEEDGSKTLNGAFGPGKIKGSTFIEYSQATTENGTLKPREELEELYKEVLAADKEVIAYCQSGVRSAYTWFVFTQILGYDNVLNYDGSWIEWSYEAYEQENPEVVKLTENGNF
jgi:thiosulfate/3-mercaptopyruvate sulfurtransferase